MGSVAENMNKAIDETAAVGPLEMIGSEVLAKLIEKMPERLRPLAVTYGPVLVKMTAVEMETFLMGALTDPVEEYKKLYKRLTTQQAIDAGEVLNGYWKQLNTANWNAADQQRLAAGELAGIAAMMLLSMA